MGKSEKQRENLRLYMAQMQTYEPACETLRKARTILGISRERIASRMGISENILRKYECGKIRIPTSMMLKIFMFGLDFWCEATEK